MNRSILFSRNFPPVVGGTCTLYSNLYLHAPVGSTFVLTAQHENARSFDEQYPHPIFRTSLNLRNWCRPFQWVELGLRAIGPVRKLKSQCEATDIHCATTFPEGVTGMIAKKAMGMRFILWVTGEDVDCYRRFRVEGPIQRKMLMAADRVIAISSNTAEICRDLGTPSEKIHIVLPGVDTRSFAFDPIGARLVREKHQAPAFPLLVTIARLQKRKGQDRVIEAMPRILHHFPKAKYLIVGDSTGAPESDADDMKRRVAELGLANAVQFVGAVPFHELSAYYSAADLFVMPNRQIGGDVEGYGLTFLEAAACGKTSVAGRSGGAIDAVFHGETGWLVDGDDQHSVTEGILKLLEDSSLRNELAAAAHKRVHGLTWDQVYQRFQAAIA